MGLPKVERASETWSPWLQDAVAALPKLGPPDQWSACLRRAGLFLLRPAQGVERALLDEFLYRMYGMYPAVLAARMAAGRGDQAGHGDSLFPDQPLPQPRNPFPLDDFVGPLPGDMVRNQPRLLPGAPPGWRWPLDFVQDLVQWARGLACVPGPAEVSWGELALDYGAFVGRALLASPDHRPRGTRLPPSGRAQYCAKRRGWLSATWWPPQCCAEPPWGGVAPSSPWGATYALAYCLPVLCGSPRGDAAAHAPPTSLPDVFGRISAALSSRAAPWHQFPPRGRRRPQPKATTSIADMFRAPLPSPRSRSAAVDVREGSPDHVVNAPPAPSTPQSTLPQRQ